MQHCKRLEQAKSMAAVEVCAFAAAGRPAGRERVCWRWPGAGKVLAEGEHEVALNKGEVVCGVARRGRQQLPGKLEPLVVALGRG